MSEERYPVVMCDGDEGMCQEFALDHTLGGLGRLVGSVTQLPDGWTGARPGDNGEHFCPEHSDANPTPTPARACVGAGEIEVTTSEESK